MFLSGMDGPTLETTSTADGVGAATWIPLGIIDADNCSKSCPKKTGSRRLSGWLINVYAGRTDCSQGISSTVGA
jgi:hypothetical protein